MSNKKNRNKSETVDPKSGLTVYTKNRKNHSRRMAYPAKFKKVAGRYIAKSVRGSLSGNAKALGYGYHPKNNPVMALVS